MLCNNLILWCPLLLLPSVFPNMRVFSSELTLCIRWPKYWSLSFSISPSNEYSVLISITIDWFDLLAVQGKTLKSLLQHQFETIISLVLNLPYGPTLTSVHGLMEKTQLSLSGPLSSKWCLCLLILCLGLYKKGLNDLDNHDGVVTHLEPDILKCQVGLRKHY